MESTIKITLPQVALALSVLFVSVLFLRRFVIRSSLDNIPGPARTSWFSGTSFMPSRVNETHSQPNAGNMKEYFAPDCWDYRDELGRKYPRVALLHGMFGVCSLLSHISMHRPDDLQSKSLQIYDPKAMYDIFVKELDSYPEPVEYV